MEKKQKNKIKKAFLMLFVLASYLQLPNTVCADGWEITQLVQVNSTDITLIQTGTTQASSQALNHIVTNQQVINSSQEVTLNQQHLSLSQRNGVNNSTQAINLINAPVKESQQILMNVGNIVLKQGNGSENIQALNAIISSKPISNLQQQVFAPTSSLRFQQDEASSGNTQAGNYLEANTVSEVQQSLHVNTVYFDQAGNNNVQAANIMIVNGDAEGMEQNFSAENVSVDFSSVSNDGSIKAANFIQYKK